LKWRRASRVLYDTKIQLKLDGKFYQRVERLTMLYGTGCLAVKNQHENKASLAEIMMLYCMFGRTT